MRRIPRFDLLEDRLAPAIVLTSGNHVFSTDPGQDLVVGPGASVEFAADVTTLHSITSDNAIVKVDAGCVLSCPSITGGALQGPGTLAVGNISWAKLTSSATVYGANLSNVTSSAILVLNGGTLDQFVNGSGGRLLVNGAVTSTGGFQSLGRTIISPIGSLEGNVSLSLGSVTTVQRNGPSSSGTSGMILGDVNIVGGLLTNHGIVGMNVSVGAGAKAVGSGMYLSVITHDGGTFSPGGSASTMAIVGGELFGSVSPSSLTTGGMLTIFDPDQGQSSFQPMATSSLYGSFTVDAAGHWTYTLDPSDPDYILVAAHVEAFNDTLMATTADGTEQAISVMIR